MATKLFPVVLVIGFIFWVAQAQSQLLTGTSDGILYTTKTSHAEDNPDHLAC